MTQLENATEFKISRVLPPHELNARRARKRLLTTPVAFKRPVASDNFQEPKASPNDHVFNHAVDSITHHE